RGHRPLRAGGRPRPDRPGRADGRRPGDAPRAAGVLPQRPGALRALQLPADTPGGRDQGPYRRGRPRPPGPVRAAAPPLPRRRGYAVSEVTATFPGGREGAAGRRPAARRAAPAMMSDGDRRTEDRGRAAPGGALPIDESETHEITLRYTRDDEPVRRDFG